jgi:hypothetical protein
MSKQQDTQGLVTMIRDGLCIDGAHHKQWFLEQILEYIVGSEEFNDFKEIDEWEQGIAP